MESSLNPMHRNIHDFEVKGYDAKTHKNLALYGTKICMPWKVMLEQKAKDAGMAVSSYVQDMIEAKFSVDVQEQLANQHGVTLAHQRRELFMHVWPDLPKWNVWNKRVLVLPNSPRRGRPAGSKNTSHTYHANEAPGEQYEPPMRNAYNDVMLDPADYITLREIAEAKNVTPQQLLRDLAHKACTNYRAAKAATEEEE